MKATENGLSEHQDVLEVFNDALERQPGERQQFLHSACDGDSSLESEVQSLLACHLDHRGFLERVTPQVLPDPPENEVGSTLSIPAPRVRSASDSQPDDGGDPSIGDFGQYRLVEELGRGGQGSVYLARDQKLGRRGAAISSLHT